MSECNLISMSGGKDSTALALLAIERNAENRRFVFADTGHEHALTYQYLDYLEDRLDISIERVQADFSQEIENKRKTIVEKWPRDGVAQERIDSALIATTATGNPMLDLSIWKGRFPSTRARFCSQELKHRPLDQYTAGLLQQFDSVIGWQGVRRDESLQRANLIVEEDHPTIQGLTWYRPILDWTADDCFAMHTRHGIEPNPLYRLGMARVGCMPCIHSRKSELAEIAERFPDEIARVANWEKRVGDASKRGVSIWYDARITARYTGIDEIKATTHGIHAAADWAKNRRQGQSELFDETAPASCSSLYGLCE